MQNYPLLQVVSNLVEGQGSVVVGVAQLERILDVDQLVPSVEQIIPNSSQTRRYYLPAQFSHHVVVTALEVVGDFELVLLVGDLRLHLGVGVVDDGQEHVEQHEEHEEDVAQEEDGPQNSVRFLNLVEVEVAQDGSQQGEHRIPK